MDNRERRETQSHHVDSARLLANSGAFSMPCVEVSEVAELTCRIGESFPTSPSTGGVTVLSPSTARVTTAAMSFVSASPSVELNSAWLYLSQNDTGAAPLTTPQHSKVAQRRAKRSSTATRSGCAQGEAKEGMSRVVWRGSKWSKSEW